MSAAAKYDLSVAWYWMLGPAAGRPEEATLMELLARIQATGSIAAGARGVGLSYRNAWGLLGRWRERLGHPLVIKERGRGTRLTPLGARLVALDARVRQRLAPALASAEEEIGRELGQALVPEAARLRICASHDIALARLPELLQRAGIEAELQVRGSYESLALFAEEHCDVAGFHCPQGAVGAPIWARYRPLLLPRRHVLARLATRTQGMMLRRGNPCGIAGVADLRRADVRFLNRQPGSGTRLLLDLLLGQARIDSAEVPGYHDIEHTHSAVAAIVATGQADVGLGIEAAARSAGLDFVPLVAEDYLLAIRREQLAEPALRTLLALVQGEDFRRLVAELPGYDATGSGSLLAPGDLPRRDAPPVPAAGV